MRREIKSNTGTDFHIGIIFVLIAVESHMIVS